MSRKANSKTVLFWEREKVRHNNFSKTVEDILNFNCVFYPCVYALMPLFCTSSYRINISLFKQFLNVKGP